MTFSAEAQHDMLYCVKFAGNDTPHALPQGVQCAGKEHRGRGG